MPKPKVSKKKQIHAIEPAILQPRLYENLRKVIRQLIEGRNYNPLTLRQLMEKLKLPEQHLDIFNLAMDSFIKDGTLQLHQGQYTLVKHTQKVIPGIIRVHFRGFGFVKPDAPSPYEEDIFIPKHLTMNAVDGDKVEVEVSETISEKGPEGKVTAILSRSRSHIAGMVISINHFGEIEAYAPLLGQSRRIVVEPSQKISLKKGDRIVMKVLDWGTKSGTTTCEVSHCIGHINDPSCDVAAAIEEFELLSEFSTKALKESAAWGTRVPASEIALREDIRQLECVTIDPDTAKDFDDAITLSKDKKGHYHLGVHIADVSYYVSEGSALDKEARQRCNSTYFPGTCLPMLPPMLSENLCSLKPNVNRLTVSVFMHFDKEGTLVKYRIARTVIKSAKRLTYREAKQILDGKKESKHANLLHLMVELCGLLKIKRSERGSIEFSLPDLIIKIDEMGIPTGIDYVAYDVTHQMIEEFMLKANELVAMHLDKLGNGMAFRIHDEPSEDNMKDFSALSNAFGFNLHEKPSACELQEFFDEALQTPYGPYLATSYIRRMRQALYSPENIGHYGLGLTHYCHFTSPIRRYVDLVVHRLLFVGAEDGIKLSLITQECSEQERISAKAETSVLLLKKLRLLDRVHQEEPFKQYKAVVTNVKPFGFSFEIFDYLLESFFHVSELDNDYFVFDDASVKLRGRHTDIIYTSGQHITVMLKEVDFIRLESKWTLVSEARSSTRGNSNRKTPFKSKSKNSQKSFIKTQSKALKGLTKALPEPAKSSIKPPAKALQKNSSKALLKSPAKALLKSPAKASLKVPAKSLLKSPSKALLKSPAKASIKPPAEDLMKTVTKKTIAKTALKQKNALSVSSQKKIAKPSKSTVTKKKKKAEA